MSDTRQTDPVCGMSVAASSPHRAEYAGRTYVFCCEGCLTTFAQDPAEVLKTAAQTPAPRRAPHTGDTPQTPAVDTTWTCPMHPEVAQRGPGHCPHCGMSLEPVLPSADAGPDAETRDMQRRCLASLPVSLVLMGVAMQGHGEGSTPGPGGNWLQLLLATPVVLWAGWPILQRWAQSLRGLRLDMWTLIGTGVGTAYLYSLAATLAPEAFPATFRLHGAIAVYFEAAAWIVSLTLLGQVLELRARGATASALHALLRLAPDTACRVRADGSEERVQLAALQPGDRLRLRPGERVPVDAQVLEGHSSVDESMLSGESLPIEKSPGSAVTGGTLNGRGTLLLRATAVGEDTVLAKIVALVAQARRSRAPMQALADRAASVFVPGVLLAAALTLLGWGLFGPAPAWSHAILNAIAVLIIACPCALGLATPMSVMVAMGRAAQAGLLFRDAETIERLARIYTLVLDKTGTLTAGTPAVIAVHALAGSTEAEVLQHAAGLEQASEHPLARAVLAEASARTLAPLPVTAFRALPGAGLEARAGETLLRLGNAALMQQAGVDIAALDATAARLQARGATVMYLAREEQALGLIAVADPLKPGAAQALAALRAAGLAIIVASGDNRATVAAVAAELGISDANGEMRPDDKFALVSRLRTAGRRVAMAGDGINDAPALAAADVGIAMGTGTDVAMASGRLTLVKGDLRAIARAITIARRTVGNMRQNLAFAFFYNAIGIPFAAGVMSPFIHAQPGPVLAALAMSLSSVSVVANALRLRAA